jgi:hypothetical protein
MARIFFMMLSSISSVSTSGSPPEISTSRTSGVRRMYSMALSMLAEDMWTSSKPTRRRRVQWRQFMEQMLVTSSSTRSG